MSGHYTSGGKERCTKDRMPRGLASFVQRVKVDYRRTFSGHFSRKTPERHQKRPSCAPVFPTKFPLAPTLAPKMPTRSVSTPNVLIPTGAREPFPIPFREVKYLCSNAQKPVHLHHTYFYHSPLSLRAPPTCARKIRMARETK